MLNEHKTINTIRYDDDGGCLLHIKGINLHCFCDDLCGFRFLALSSLEDDAHTFFHHKKMYFLRFFCFEKRGNQNISNSWIPNRRVKTRTIEVETLATTKVELKIKCLSNTETNVNADVITLNQNIYTKFLRLLLCVFEFGLTEIWRWFVECIMYFCAALKSAGPHYMEFFMGLITHTAWMHDTHACTHTNDRIFQRGNDACVKCTQEITWNERNKKTYQRRSHCTHFPLPHNSSDCIQK